MAKRGPKPKFGQAMTTEIRVRLPADLVAPVRSLPRGVKSRIVQDALRRYTTAQRKPIDPSKPQKGNT